MLEKNRELSFLAFKESETVELKQITVDEIKKEIISHLAGPHDD
jgi:hypothetical protein